MRYFGCLLLLLILLGGCAAPFNYFLCDDCGTVSLVTYPGGVAKGHSEGETAAVSAKLGYNAGDGLFLALGIEAWGDNEDDIDFFPMNVRLMDGSGRVIRRYDADEWLGVLESRGRNEMFLAGLFGSAEIAARILPQLLNGGDLGLSNIRQLDPSRINRRIDEAAAAHEERVEDASHNTLLDDTLGPGEKCYGYVHFGNRTPDWLLLMVKVGGDSHEFVFRRSFELDCEEIPSAFR